VDRESTPKKQSNQADIQPSSSLILSADKDYQIGPNDVIELFVEHAPELSRLYRINAAGNFSLQYLGNVSALNKTPDELAQFIADSLRKEEYFKDPHVTVEVKQYNSRTFFIQGSVNHPGVYQIEGNPSLLKLIIIAGGLNGNHGSTAFIIREIKGEATDSNRTEHASAPAVLDNASNAKFELLTRNINGLLKGSFDQDILIEPGDIVNIPATDVFVVAGEVNAPGSFPLKDGTTLRQAISLAQGLTFKAAAGRATIFREDPTTGKRKELVADINAIMSGKKEDIKIMANDTLLVPNSRMKSLGSVLLNAFGFGLVRRSGLPLGY
jgi:polysaccharide export outer membrane protein